MFEDERGQFLAGGHVPLADGVVATGGQHARAIRQKRDCRDAARVSVELRHDAGLVDVPELDVPLGITRRQQTVIGRKRHGGDLGEVGLKLLQPLSGGGIPQLGRLVVAPRRDPLRIVREYRRRTATAAIQT